MKTFVLASIGAASLLLSGCQTSSYMATAATDGDGVTCSEIYQAFESYSQDRQSAEALTELSRAVNPTAANYAEMGVNQASKYYEQIKASANVALAMRGCQPVN
ncbi:hypothetical protein [Marinobacter sp. MDS2]|uniref:hypothetical protein n=1 Tax=Marinobacter sp. MDS2 TaxID=3065961 RepID=UPI00273B6AEF|nr:hypothetical protein [Marinobacter sp. MDS2]MDP4547108.1 hypothetical protein [Marinobacter sp. MDS2]